MFVEDPLHHHLDLGPRGFAERPVDGDTLLHLGDQLRRDEFELVIAHWLHGAVIRGEGVVEPSRWGSERDRQRKAIRRSRTERERRSQRDLVVCQSHILAAQGGSAGAGTSLWLATRDDPADPAASDPVLRESSRVCAAVINSTQATYDLTRWESSLGPADPSWFKSDEEGPQFYGLKTLDDFKTDVGKKALAECDMLGWISKDDGPIMNRGQCAKCRRRAGRNRRRRGSCASSRWSARDGLPCGCGARHA